MRFLAILAVLSHLVGRGLAPALPGSRAGLDVWIRSLDLAAALLSQPVAVGGTLLATLLLYGALINPRLGIFFRLAIVPGGAAATALILRTATLTASEQRLAAPMLIGMAVVTSLVLWTSAARALARTSTRAPGMVLALSALTALFGISSRSFAWLLDPESTTTGLSFSGWTATIAFVAQAACLATIWAWLVAGRMKLASLLGGSVALASLFAAIIVHGALPVESWWQVWAERTLFSLLRSPGPFVQEELRVALEIATLLTAVVATFSRARNGWLGAASGLVLLGAGSPDIPLSALCSLLGGLIIVSMASLEAPAGTSTVLSELGEGADVVKVGPAEVSEAALAALPQGKS